MPSGPRKYLETTTLVAVCDQAAGISTSFCSKTAVPVSSVMDRRAQLPLDIVVWILTGAREEALDGKRGRNETAADVGLGLEDHGGGIPFLSD